jgi:hypothetical protein
MFKLAPEAADRVADIPTKNASITREPDEVVELGSPLGIGEKGLKLLRVKTGHFTVNISIGMPKKASRLIVTFAGARRDSKGSTDERRPFLSRRKWLQVYGGAVLAISDPQTDAGAAVAGLRTGFYMGTFEHDLVPEILKLITHVCDELKIPRNKVVFYGAGAGGSSAMLVASRRKESTGVIAVNPLLRPEKYGDSFIATVARTAEGTVADWEKLRSTNVGRNNPLSAFRDGLTDGHDLRLVVAQNLKDQSTINRHFPGLWRRFEMDPNGGVSSNGRVMILTYEGPETNRGEEPNEFSQPLLAKAYAFFDGPITPGAVYKAPPEGEAEEEGPEADLDDDVADVSGDAEDAPAASPKKAGGGKGAGGEKPDPATKAANKAANQAAKAAKGNGQGAPAADKPDAAAKAAKQAANQAAKAAKGEKKAGKKKGGSLEDDVADVSEE